MDFALIVANGVVFRDTPEHPPITSGIRLVRALNTHYKISLSLPAYKVETSKRVLVSERLREEGLFAPYVFWGEDFTVHRHLLQPNVVSLFVSANPAECAEQMRRGLPTLLFAHPSYAREEFRPDARRETRAWDAIEEESKQQALLRAQEEYDESLEYLSEVESRFVDEDTT